LSDLPIPIDSIQGISLDSRVTKAGELFFACGQDVAENTAYIKDAVERGAIGVVLEKGLAPVAVSVPVAEVSNLPEVVGLLASEYFGYPSRSLNMIGVTGTNGKTSVCQFIARVLAELDQSCGLIGTLGHGFPGNLTPSNLTTPVSTDIHKYLSELKSSGARSIAMEVTSHALEKNRIAGVEFDIVVFTNLSQDHLDYHGDMASYGAAKEVLFTLPGIKYGVVNIDDSFGRELVSKYKDTFSLITYSLDETSGADVTAKLIRFEKHGFRAVIKTPEGEGEIFCHLFGSFNLSNVLATVAVLTCLGQIPVDNLESYPQGADLVQILNAIQSLGSVLGRMQTVGDGGKPLVIVDFAHTPDALAKALEAIREHHSGQICCVFGCGGDRDSSKRPKMAKIVESLADKLIITNDNPRFEDPQQIATDMLAGLTKPELVHVELDRAKAIKLAIEQADADDIILIAGKGHEDYQEVNGVRKHFSDIEQVERLTGSSII